MTNHFSTQFCEIAATMMSENLCLDCARKNNPISKVYCLSGNRKDVPALPSFFALLPSAKTTVRTAGKTLCIRS